MEEIGRSYGIYTLAEFERAVVFIKQAWTLAKTTQSYSKFDAINGKYERQTLLNVRAMWPPTVTHKVVENWIYAKDTRAVVSPANEE